MTGLLEIQLSDDWPSAVRVAQTLRSDAHGPLDLALAAGSAPRQRLQRILGLSDIRWLRQVHGRRVVLWPDEADDLPEADAIATARVAVACAVLTADCLPVLLARRDGSMVAAVHAGWRGLASGVIEQAVRVLGGDVLALLGPAIGMQAYEVGPEVREALIADDPQALALGCRRGRGDRWHADLQMLARLRLERLGVPAQVVDIDVHADAERFFSHRRDGSAGRQASLIWISPDPRSSGG